MAELIGGTVGAVVGFAVTGGNPVGAQWGWAIGAMVGGSSTTVQQPRIGDLAEVRASEGGARARVYGTFRPLGGQVVWAGRPRENRTRQRQGKGGPRVETSTILRSYAIGICEGPITGVTRIWRNTDLVYDVRPGSPIAAESARWMQGKTLLLGGWDQLPHPTIEAEAGAGNAPAMRGTALLVVTDEDLTDMRGAIPAYQFEASAQPTVALDVIVRGICEAARIPPSRIDTTALAGNMVFGYAASPQYSAAEAIAELGKVYFFDMQDADGVLRFVPRGGSSIATVTEAEFVEEESEPEKDTTRDSMSVPRMLHLMYHDLAGGLAADKQMSERESSLRVDAPTVVSTPVVMDAWTAARVIATHHRVMEEDLRGEMVFGLSDARLAITESDVIVVQYRGRSQRCRVTRAEILDGWQRITAVRDRQSAYTVQALAKPPAPVTPPPSTIPGPTRFAFLDLPALSQDVLGYHIATSGETAAWRGAIVEREEVGGQWSVVATDGMGAIIGTLTAPLPRASEWYSDETNAITVQLARVDDELSSITRDVWLARGNSAAIVRVDGSAEIVQFRDAVETVPGTWRLSGLLRGRLNTGTSEHGSGAVFVMLDGVIMVPATTDRIMTDMKHRHYSGGNAVTVALVNARKSAVPSFRRWTGRSQREWPPIIDSVSMFGNTLTVSWTPRHRFGGDVNPIASANFTGWHVTATSWPGMAAVDTTGTTASLDVAGFSLPIMVLVRARNRLTGLGDPAARLVL